MLKKNKDILENINEIYFKSLENTHKNTEYIKNKKKLDNIIKIIEEKTDAPKELIDLLIECIEENTALEYELANKEIYKYLLKNID